MTAALEDYRMRRQQRSDETGVRDRAKGVIVALVRLAQDVDPEFDSNAPAVARYEWGALLPRSPRP